MHSSKRRHNANMPLLDRKEHPPGAKVPPKSADEVFVVRCTGEVVRTYEEYTNKRTLYAQHQWQDKYYGRTGLTYEEALRFEEQAENQLVEQFPKDLEESVVRQIHHSRLKKDDLIHQIHSSLKPRGAQPTDSDKENGTPASSTPRAHPVTKRLLTHFLIYVADKIKPGIWVCKEQWVQKYGLPADLPAALQLTAAQPSSPNAAGAKNSAAAALAGDSTPMKTPCKNREAAEAVQPVRTLEEEEARLRPGTVKETAFIIMKARGTQPTTVEDVIRISTIDGTRTDWPDKSKKNLAHVLMSDNAFTRVARGQYVLTALAKDLPLLSPAAESGPSGGVSAAQASKGAVEASRGDKPQQSGKEAAEGSEAGLARAEQLLAQAQKAVAARQADLTAINEQLEVCEKRLSEAKTQHKSATKSSPAKQQAADADGLPTAEELEKMFALPENLREYCGPEDDRKAKSAWRTEKAKKEKELAAKRTKYLQEQRLKVAKDAQASVSGLQQAYDRAKKSVEEASARLGKALKAEAEAKRAVEREKQREMLKGIKEKAKEDKEKQKQAEKEEREKRRQEALAAKRYPIDDLELLTEGLTAAVTAAASTHAAGSSAAAAQVPATTAEQLDLTCLADAKHLGPDESLELGQLLYVADTLSQFRKQLGVNGCTHAELRSMLAAATVKSANVAGAERDNKQQVKEARQWMAATYTQLLTVLNEDITQLDGTARVFNRWSDALESGPGAWPELARRWVLLQEQDHLASPEALEVAAHLRTHEVSSLKPQQHLALLTQLLDDCIDTNRIRDALANRIERGAELVAEIRAELVEGRKKLKELQEAERESRKRKRAAALALATAAAERQLREKGELPAGAEAAAAADPAAADVAEGSAAAEDGKDSEAAASGSAKDTVAKKIQQTTKEILARVAGPGATNVTPAELEAELAGDFEEEPSWELPPELQSYSGPAGDKKMMSEFRRKQQEARKKLDKERAKWQAGKAERAKIRADAKKKEIEAERRLHAERTRAEQELAEQQESLELKLEKYLVRRQPLGSDRFNRMYWWGLAGNKEGLLLQQETGCAETMLQLLREAAQEAVAAQAAADKHKPEDGAAPMAVDQQQQQNDCASPSAAKQHGGSPVVQSPMLLAWPLDHKGLLLPAGPEGWALLDNAELLETLLNNLEQRGVREKELKQTLDKMLPAMSAAISKAAAAKAAAEAADSASKKGKPKKEKEPIVHRELPSRHARSAAAEQIKKTSSAAAAVKAKEEATTAAAAAAAAAVADDDESGVFHGWQLAAVKGAVHNLQELSAAAAAAKAAPPAPDSTWAQYRKQLDALIQGDIPASWQEAAAAAAAAALTAAGSPAAAASSAITPKDASYSKAVQAAAAAAVAVDSAPEGDKQQAEAAAAVAQLRLQLLLFEQQLVAATGELAYLYRGAAAAAAEEDEQDAESEGEVEEPEQQQQQSGSEGPKAESSKQQAPEQQDEANGVEQQAAIAAGKGKGRKGKTASRGAKRAASAACSGNEALAASAEEEKGSHAGADDRASKRRKAAGAADPGLPPRPAGRARAAAAASDAAKADMSPLSREGSVAPTRDTDLAAPSNKRGRPAKRTAAAAGSRATSQEPEQQDEEQKWGSKKQKQAEQRGRGSNAVAARDEEAADDVTNDVTNMSEDVEDADNEDADKRRQSLAHHKHHSSEQTDDPDEVVAEEGDDIIPIRLRGKTIWIHGGERDSWRASVAAAATASGLSYCGAALVFHAQQPLEALAAAKASAGKKTASKKK